MEVFAFTSTVVSASGRSILSWISAGWTGPSFAWLMSSFCCRLMIFCAIHCYFARPCVVILLTFDDSCAIQCYFARPGTEWAPHLSRQNPLLSRHLFSPSFDLRQVST